ncbi:MAG: hypothetical protein ACM3S2_05600 [Ignavibacteriales bacterium]
MNKVLVLSALLLLSVPLLGQEETAWDAKFAAGGGFTPGWIVPDYSGINENIESFGLPKFSSSGFFATGGTGYISIAIIKNIRIGGMGLGGSVSNSTAFGGLRREAKYSVAMGGVTIEYTLPFIRSVAVSIGTIIGGGSNSIEYYENMGAETWGDIWSTDPPRANITTVNRKIYNDYFLISPTLNVDIPFYRFLAFRIGGGYNIALSNNWKIDNGQDVINVPSNVSSNSYFIQAGIFIGFFNY